MIDHGKWLAKYNLPDEIPGKYTIRQLTGDASSRSYFRIWSPENQTLILMKMPEAFEEKAFPYLDNYYLLRSACVPLAEVYFMEPSRGYVFLQDLGDQTFYELYEQWDDQARLDYYLTSMKYLGWIEHIQPESRLTFDTEKFLWELNYFQKYFLFAFRGITLSEKEETELQEHYLGLASELAAQPRVFCHRDYHSRNLMVHGGEVFVIDFQDARYGPSTYDLASLCYDSYIQHSPEFIRHLERLFFTEHPDARIQRFEYPRMCLQRNLKALGTFGYQVSQMDRPFYLQFMEPTLGYVKRHFRNLPEYAGLRKLLARHLLELE